MDKRQIVKLALEHQPVPYTPWSLSFTLEAHQTLQKHYGSEDLNDFLHNHILRLGSAIGHFDDLGDDRYRDVFGVTWDRSRDKDIGMVEGLVLPEPVLDTSTFPDPTDPQLYANIPEKLLVHPELYRVYSIGFSLFERAWTLRGMENLLMDFYEHPEFVRALLRAIADHNIARVQEALRYDIDAVYFGDDWGQQHGLIMGPVIWRDFIKPELARMYGAVKQAGKKVFIHSCGDVDELFADLHAIGLDCFNPFQPEVMDVFALMDEYRGRLAFHGGLSTQQTLPYGSVDDVLAETRALLAAGRRGGYIFSPAHAVEGDVPLDNMLAFIHTVLEQPGFVEMTRPGTNTGSINQ